VEEDDVEHPEEQQEDEEYNDRKEEMEAQDKIEEMRQMEDERREEEEEEQKGVEENEWEDEDKASSLPTEEQIAKQSRELTDARAVVLRLEGASPRGGQITVSLNGQATVLRPLMSGPRPGLFGTVERRFAIAPLHGDRETTNSAEVAPPTSVEGEPEVEPGVQAEMPDEEARHADNDVTSRTEDEIPATFSATVMLDSSELQARTRQVLVEPELEVMEVFEDAVVLRLTNLSGDRFELTVYPSGTPESGSAATLVQQGPVRNASSVHRMLQLESAQVYVAWVKVFCDGDTMESKQKGFKTLQAKQKTIWDELDHIILGIQETATVKEISRAWRHKSLQFHPDKESDPDKKDAAEEMMKRLNLAKQNMLRKTPPGDGSPATMPPTPSSCPSKTPGGQQTGDFFPHGFPEDSSGSDDDSGNESPRRRKHQARRSSRFSSRDVDQRKPVRLSEGLHCSLHVEAPAAPRLRVAERGLTFLRLEASQLPVGCRIEVQRFVDSEWQLAAEPVQATSHCTTFTVEDLEENSVHRLRLRAIAELEPLRLLFARLVEAR